MNVIQTLFDRNKAKILIGGAIILAFVTVLVSVLPGKGSMGIQEMSLSSESAGYAYQDDMEDGGSSYNSVAPASASLYAKDMIEPPYRNQEAEYDGEAVRHLVKNGSLSMSVPDIQNARNSISLITLTHDGFVASENFYGNNKREGEYPAENTSGSVTVKVPVENFMQAMNEFRELALVVISDSTNVNDVTEQYVDLETRLANKRQEEAQYRSLLSEAETVTETLEVVRYIEQARSEAERLEGQLNVMKNQTTLSTINIYLESEKTVAVLGVDWNPKNELNQALSGLVQGLVALASGVMYFFLMLPLVALYVLVYGLGLFIAYRLVKWLWYKLKHVL